jgi:hypothetical protein
MPLFFTIVLLVEALLLCALAHIQLCGPDRFRNVKVGFLNLAYAVGSCVLVLVLTP